MRGGRESICLALHHKTSGVPSEPGARKGVRRSGLALYKTTGVGFSLKLTARS